ncbi:MAG: hypothetical protein E7083_02680 [Bacteroidales bacterium]|nr:hypothetical protein [Bacteroidales bacterium]
MLYTNTLYEISTNINTGVEYEIALFYQLVSANEQQQILTAINKRADKNKILGIIKQTNITPIVVALSKRGLKLSDATFETQNDKVGPSDVVMLVSDGKKKFKIGISVKYANTCTLNVTGRRFITDAQIAELKKQLPIYTKKYIDEMTATYGNVGNWFRLRRPSETTDAFIDLIRDAVIDNWSNVGDKPTLLSAMFHSDSPIEFWVVTYMSSGYKLSTEPQTIEVRRANDVKVAKYQTSYVAFYLDNKKVGQMQVKFNNGFIEKCKKKTPDIVYEGVKMAYGQPFSSWNFSVEE